MGPSLYIQTAMYLERDLEDSTSQVHYYRQTVKNAGRGFAPETQDEDIVDEVFVDVDNADDDGDNIHASAFDSCVSESQKKYRYHFAQTIRLFKPNILFKSFEMKDTVDRVLVYVTLYIVGE